MNCQKLNNGKALEVLKRINEVYKKRLWDVRNQFYTDIEIYHVTCMEWVQTLQKYTMTLIELIEDLFIEATTQIETSERRNNCSALKLPRNDCQIRDYCSESSRSKSENSFETEKKLCIIHAEDQSYIDILNNEVQYLLEICNVQDKTMKVKERMFSSQKDKIVKLVKSLMARIKIGQQRLSKFMSSAICVNELLSENTQVYETDSSIFQDLRSKILEMRMENQCLKDQIEILQVQSMESLCGNVASVQPICNSSVQKAGCASQQCYGKSSEVLRLECDLKIKSERVQRLRENIAHLQRELKN